MPTPQRKSFSGTEAQYVALHRKMYKLLPRPELCTNCHAKRAIDLANISGKYTEKLTDWEYLCRFCHMTKDGRINNLTKIGTPGFDIHKRNPNRKPRGKSNDPMIRFNNVKLTEDIALHIKTAVAENTPIKDLAKEFGVTYNTVWRIANGSTWKHLAVNGKGL